MCIAKGNTKKENDLGVLYLYYFPPVGMHIHAKNIFNSIILALLYNKHDLLFDTFLEYL